MAVAQHGIHEALMAEGGLYKELVVRRQAMEVAKSENSVIR